VEVIDSVIPDGIAAADHTRKPRKALDEVAGQKERRRHVLAAQDGQHALRAVRVPAAVERQRDDVLTRLQAHDLSGDDRRRERDHASPGSRIPGTSARKAGTGSPSARATMSTAP